MQLRNMKKGNEILFYHHNNDVVCICSRTIKIFVNRKFSVTCESHLLSTRIKCCNTATFDIFTWISCNSRQLTRDIVRQGECVTREKPLFNNIARSASGKQTQIFIFNSILFGFFLSSTASENFKLFHFLFV